MVKTKQNKGIRQNEVPTSVDLNNVSEEQRVEFTPNFVVTRGGVRVSDFDYSSANDPKAVEEKNFWQRVVSKFPDGTRVEIVPFDKKKHRIW